ncbi:MAG: hypothetical protein EWV42_10585 [Microcystis panniformis Mp_GB_SS_20050300_S99D]|nr:MAG: hypothetical protein EWV87_17830 [Microcystis panniformis Mp_GB_SS_20050300_S99]TRV48257.1 MAG: hypothetical protein EWV43_10880 [Microcystis panniformis Mp_MB_F_20080800_S26D]TRV50971.1 MAG: hypothetical protein EWV42_10585 [Microcystis panniformis Mp_GB_SS_20050300_S99D]TRV59285.1 MAG: hypothetical protein EWV69_12105 [Microcystis panniformis Mp_MB_F_20080800_S26]
MFRARKPAKTWLQRESLTLEINDTICYNQVSDHYTANSRSSLYSRYSQRYSHFQGKNVPSGGLSTFSEKPHKGFVNFLVFLSGVSPGIT